MYPNTIRAIRKEITARYSEAEYKEDPNGSPSINHLLWMCDRVIDMTVTRVEFGKAGRWIGWMLAQCETRGWWTNTHSRDLVRVDVANGDA